MKDIRWSQIKNERLKKTRGVSDAIPKQKIYKTLQKGRIKMRRTHLTRQEKAIEDSLLKNEYLDVNKMEFEAIAQTVAARRKDTVLNIRVNSYDLKAVRQKARKLGIRYQTFISELIHRIAQVN